jgi:hypothetical protein
MYISLISETFLSVFCFVLAVYELRLPALRRYCVAIRTSAMSDGAVATFVCTGAAVFAYFLLVHKLSGRF